jgi:hypothetical protein
MWDSLRRWVANYPLSAAFHARADADIPAGTVAVEENGLAPAALTS